MPFQAILREVDQLHNVSARLEALAEQHPSVSGPLMTIAGSVQNTATLLEVPVATKSTKPQIVAANVPKKPTLEH
jgi:hypothetical protein